MIYRNGVHGVGYDMQFLYVYIDRFKYLLSSIIPLECYCRQSAMAGWLGSNFTAQLDQLKKGVSQVSTIVKDTLVVDETWDQEEVEYF